MERGEGINNLGIFQRDIPPVLAHDIPSHARSPMVAVKSQSRFRWLWIEIRPAQVVPNRTHNRRRTANFETIYFYWNSDCL